MLAHGELGEQLHALERARRGRGGRGVCGLRWVTSTPLIVTRPALRAEQARQHAEERGLAGAVGTHEPDGRPCGHRRGSRRRARPRRRSARSRRRPRAAAASAVGAATAVMPVLPADAAASARERLGLVAFLRFLELSQSLSVDDVVDDTTRLVDEADGPETEEHGRDLARPDVAEVEPGERRLPATPRARRPRPSSPIRTAGLAIGAFATRSTTMQRDAERRARRGSP